MAKSVEMTDQMFSLTDEMIQVVKSKPHFQFAAEARALSAGDLLQVQLVSMDVVKGDRLDCDADGILLVCCAASWRAGMVSHHVKSVTGDALLSFTRRAATEWLNALQWF